MCRGFFTRRRREEGERARRGAGAGAGAGLSLSQQPPGPLDLLEPLRQDALSTHNPDFGGILKKHY